MPSRRIDQFVGLACFVLLLLTKGAAIAGAPGTGAQFRPAQHCTFFFRRGHTSAKTESGDTERRA